MSVTDGYTCSVENLSKEHFGDNTLFIFPRSASEPRSRIALWDRVKIDRPENVIEIAEQEDRAIVVVASGAQSRVVLTDSDALQNFVKGRQVAIDISGLSHHVWAPWIRAGLVAAAELSVVYVEPKEYRAHPSPASALVFQLSVSFDGIQPLPGFANLRGPSPDSEEVFVPLLGFEGNRARYLATNLDPTPRTVPVVGLPGFRAEYPQVTVISNWDFLYERDAYQGIRYARASCPFEAYAAIEDIHRDNPGSYLYLAPVGTKPHALGAVWYAIDHPADTEVMYDHPRRRAQRTDGIGVAHIYQLKVKGT